MIKMHAHDLKKIHMEKKIKKLQAFLKVCVKVIMLYSKKKPI